MIEHPQGTTILVLGILGWVLCPICSIIAWVMGSGAKKQIRAGMYRESGSLTAGYILGMVGSILAILGGLFYLFVFVLFVSEASTRDPYDNSFYENGDYKDDAYNDAYERGRQWGSDYANNYSEDE